MKKKGFTLVELLAVTVILAIILVIAVPQINKLIVNGRKSTLVSSAQSIASAAETKYIKELASGNEVLLSCNDLTEIEESMYDVCYVEIKNGRAEVTIVGKDKFDGMLVCSATKSNSTLSDSCGHNVTFDPNGGELVTGDNVVLPSYSKNVTYGSTYGALPNARKSGYTLEGWYTQRTGGEKITENSIDEMVQEHTLYAHWEAGVYAITLNPNGGTYNGTTSNTVISESFGNTFSVTNNPTKAGYVFGGWKLTNGNADLIWYDESDLLKQYIINDEIVDTPSVYNNSGGNTVTHTIISDSTSSTRYSMRIVTNGTASPGAGGFCNYTSAVAGGVFYHKIVAKIPVGYNIAIASNTRGIGSSQYWLTDVAGTGDWKTYIYITTCGYNGGFSTFGHVYVTGSDNTSVTWYLQESSMYKISGSKAETDATTMGIKVKDSNATLTAQWVASGSRITFDTQGGTLASGTNNYKDMSYNTAYSSDNFAPYYVSGSSYTISKNGYTFGGWYTESTGGTQVFTASGKLVPSVTNYSDASYKWLYYTQNKILYARWIPNTYTLTYNANGGSVSPASATVTYGSTYGSLPTPTRANYGFLGWYTAASGGTQVTSSTTVTNASNHTIYAHWELLFTLSFTYANGSFGVGTTLADAKANTMTNTSYSTTDTDWQIYFLTSGTLTINGVSSNVDLFAVGGGSSGGIWCAECVDGAQGGSGGYTTTVRNQTLSLSPTSYSVTIGAGGAKSASSVGGTTSFGSLITAAGGNLQSGGGSGGGCNGYGTNSSYKNGRAGGSNGGNGNSNGSYCGTIRGQGSPTRAFGEDSGELYSGGGGGGAGSGGTAGSGGAGGGAKGGAKSGAGAAAAANTGGGGGGCGACSGYGTAGGVGGSGVVIMRNAR